MRNSTHAQDHVDPFGLLDPLNELDLYALHCIYVPRINRQIQVFQHAWNNHRMRTTRGQTPLQIFMLHANDAFLQEAEQISNYSFYGIDEDGPIPSSFQKVVVPKKLHCLG